MRLFNVHSLCAPERGDFIAVCPHCWGVNVRAERLCGRCGADMHLLLQESGGLRATAPVQSPVPVRVRHRLTPLQRALVLCFLLVLVAAQFVVAFWPPAPRPLPAQPAGQSSP
jgi:hypothetical protein